MDAQDLAHTARELEDTYRQLDQLKWHKQPREQLRPMKPHLGPGDPTPDRGWAFNIEQILVTTGDDDSSEDAPSGLLEMTQDAQRYTNSRSHLPKTGWLLAWFIGKHAEEIAERFPAAEDLAELMAQQTTYIKRAIHKRYGKPNTDHIPPDTLKTGHGTAADLAPLVSATIGQVITRDQIRYWGRAGKITTYTNPEGQKTYQLTQVIEFAENYRDQRKKKNTA